MKKIASVLFALTLALSYGLSSGMAASFDEVEMGTITVNIKNAQGQTMAGNWILHQGGLEGLSVRNGLSGETFEKPAGKYYLEVRKVHQYPLYLVSGSNPATLEVNGAVTFEVMYFMTEAEKEIAILRANNQEPAVTESTEPEPTEPETGEVSAASEEEEEPAPAPKPTPKPLPKLYVPDFSTPPAKEVLPFDKAPEGSVAASAEKPTDESSIAGASGLGAVPMLAQTGSFGMLFLIPSFMGGLLAVRRRK